MSMYDFVVFKNHEILKTRSIKKKNYSTGNHAKRKIYVLYKILVKLI